MPRYTVNYVLIRGMERTLNASSKEEAIKIIKDDPEEGIELDHEIQIVECI